MFFSRIREKIKNRFSFAPLAWWFRLTALPEPSPYVQVSFQEREKIRSSRFLSTITSVLFGVFITFIPGSIVIPNHYVIFADLGMMPCCIMALILNRCGYPKSGGILLTVTFECALAIVILTTRPFDPPSLQQYELFVFGLLLAVCLISASWGIIIAVSNCIFIIATMLLIPPTPELALDMHVQFAAIVIRPVSVQLLVALATYLWATSSKNALLRADRAETVARLESQLAHEHEIAALKNARLETFIRKLIEHYVVTANRGDGLSAQVPHPPEDEQVLVPLVNIFESSRRRLLRAQRTEQEYELLKQELQKLILELQSRDNNMSHQESRGIYEIDILRYLIFQDHKE
jgi:hypothetical protein